MIERYLLRYFLAVADHGSFTRAAQSCNVSQPTLSVGIAKLEGLLKASLFRRTNQRIELTEAGARLMPYARRIESEFNQALATVSGEGEHDVVRIGILSSIPTSIVAECIGANKGDAQNERIEIITGTERELSNALERGRVDVALTLVRRGMSRFTEQALGQEGYALAMPLDHPLAQRTEIAADELASEVMIVRRHCEVLSDTSRHFTERGVRPHFAFRSTSDDAVLRFVAAGLGITVMPLSYAQADIAQPRLAGFDFTRTIGLVVQPHMEWLFSEPPSFVQMLQEHVLRSLNIGHTT